MQGWLKTGRVELKTVIELEAESSRSVAHQSLHRCHRHVRNAALRNQEHGAMEPELGQTKSRAYLSRMTYSSRYVIDQSAAQ